MTTTNAPLLVIHNRHDASCGEPPHFSNADGAAYLGYFQNELGEQWVFVYDRPSGQATIRGGDLQWDKAVTITSLREIPYHFTAAERRWVAGSWLVANASQHAARTNQAAGIAALPIVFFAFAILLTGTIIALLYAKSEVVNQTDTTATGTLSNERHTVANQSTRNDNVPTNTSTNASAIPGWKTYDSRSAQYSTVQRLYPSFTISFPAQLQTDEDLGGFYLSEAGHSNLEPVINIYRIKEVFNNILEDCKELLTRQRTMSVFDIERIVTISGNESAYLSYHLPKHVQTHPSARDGILVCVPVTNGTDLIDAHPRSSDLVRRHFDTILSTYTVAF